MPLEWIWYYDWINNKKKKLKLEEDLKNKRNISETYLINLVTFILYKNNVIIVNNIRIIKDEIYKWYYIKFCLT